MFSGGNTVSFPIVQLNEREGRRERGREGEREEGGASRLLCQRHVVFVIAA